ncbi:MAG: hypothetical protein WC879_03560 [Melioribacteraceae bacterium]
MIQTGKKSKLKQEVVYLDGVLVLLIYRLEMKKSNIDINYQTIICN